MFKRALLLRISSPSPGTERKLGNCLLLSSGVREKCLSPSPGTEGKLPASVVRCQGEVSVSVTRYRGETARLCRQGEVSVSVTRYRRETACLCRQVSGRRVCLRHQVQSGNCPPLSSGVREKCLSPSPGTEGKLGNCLPLSSGVREKCLSPSPGTERKLPASVVRCQGEVSVSTYRVVPCLDLTLRSVEYKAGRSARM
jgi:hypothetical protein